MGRHALGGDFEGLSLGFGFWILNPKKREKLHCLQGANPVLPQGKGPLGGTLAKFFSAFWELFQIFKKHNVYEPNIATPIFFIICFWVRLVRGVQIFEPVGKKLLGRHALGGDFGGLFLYLGCLGLHLEIWPKKNEKKLGNKQQRKKK